MVSGLKIPLVLVIQELFLVVNVLIDIIKVTEADVFFERNYRIDEFAILSPRSVREVLPLVVQFLAFVNRLSDSNSPIENN
jgi:hypothetical protein